MFRFESPWMFLVLLLLPLVVYLHARRGSAGALRFSATAYAKRAGTSLRQNLMVLPLVIRVLALVALVIALARPQMGTEQVRDISRGVAIEMVLDRSSSMGAELRYEGRRTNFLEMSKKVFQQFVQGDGKELGGRPTDLIGMVTFARYADTVCPLTLAHDALLQFLPTVKLVDQQNEDGTAIGDAVALAAARLQKAEETLALQSGAENDYEIKSKVIILLTDGVNNAGERTVEQAAKLAKQWGIKIYAIGIGGGANSRHQTLFGTFNLPGQGINEEALKMLAETTGGIHRVTEDPSDLREVYEEIDKLETTDIETTRFLDYREVFPPFALIGLGLLILEVGLGSTVFRRIP